MNIVKQTFNGMHITVTYKCGHRDTQLSRSTEETKKRKQVAEHTDCWMCMLLHARQSFVKVTCDPVSLQLAARRKQAMDMLANKFASMRTQA